MSAPPSCSSSMQIACCKSHGALRHAMTWHRAYIEARRAAPARQVLAGLLSSRCRPDVVCDEEDLLCADGVPPTFFLNNGGQRGPAHLPAAGATGRSLPPGDKARSNCQIAAARSLLCAIRISTVHFVLCRPQRSGTGAQPAVWDHTAWRAGHKVRAGPRPEPAGCRVASSVHGARSTLCVLETRWVSCVEVNVGHGMH